jgi:hypothetical protein
VPHRRILFAKALTGNSIHSSPQLAQTVAAVLPTYSKRLKKARQLKLAFGVKWSMMLPPESLPATVRWLPQRGQLIRTHSPHMVTAMPSNA